MTDPGASGPQSWPRHSYLNHNTPAFASGRLPSGFGIAAAAVAAATTDAEDQTEHVDDLDAGGVAMAEFDPDFWATGGGGALAMDQDRIDDDDDVPFNMSAEHSMGSPPPASSDYDLTGATHAADGRAVAEASGGASAVAASTAGHGEQQSTATHGTSSMTLDPPTTAAQGAGHGAVGNCVTVGFGNLVAGPDISSATTSAKVTDAALDAAAVFASHRSAFTTCIPVLAQAKSGVGVAAAGGTIAASAPGSSTPAGSIPANSNSSKRRRNSTSMLLRATTGLVGVYQRSNAAYKYMLAANPRRALTKPSIGVKNDNADNENSDLVLHVGDVLVNDKLHPGDSGHRQYVVQEMLGCGTFGQVVSCWNDGFGCNVAVKVIKNQPAYYHQARVEIGLLHLLNGRCDPSGEHHIVRMIDYFLHKKHLCIVFEQLDLNLFELLKRNNFRGLSLQLVRLFLSQILDALVVLHDAAIIHCDLKPENILLANSYRGEEGQVRLIDFGSACFENRTVYSYIQSRFYRSPEVVLGCSYGVSIDMWSLGCVAAELFLGLPLFPGASEHDLLSRIVQTFGLPPDWLLGDAKHTDKFFKRSSHHDAISGSGTTRYRLLNQAEFELRNACKAPSGKRYFAHTGLLDILMAYPMKLNMQEADMQWERQQRVCFHDFLLGILHLDPRKRWTPRQAAAHPFMTGKPLTGPYQPVPDPKRPSPYAPHDSTPPPHGTGPAGPTPLQPLVQPTGAVAAAAAAAGSATGLFAPGHKYDTPIKAHRMPQAATAQQATFPSASNQAGSLPSALSTQQQAQQLSPAHAQAAHQQAHAIAMAALQQLSPQFGFLGTSLGPPSLPSSFPHTGSQPFSQPPASVVGSSSGLSFMPQLGASVSLHQGSLHQGAGFASYGAAAAAAIAAAAATVTGSNLGASALAPPGSPHHYTTSLNQYQQQQLSSVISGNHDLPTLGTSYSGAAFGSSLPHMFQGTPGGRNSRLGRASGSGQGTPAGGNNGAGYPASTAGNAASSAGGSGSGIGVGGAGRRPSLGVYQAFGGVSGHSSGGESSSGDGSGTNASCIMNASSRARMGFALQQQQQQPAYVTASASSSAAVGRPPLLHRASAPVTGFTATAATTHTSSQPAGLSDMAAVPLGSSLGTHSSAHLLSQPQQPLISFPASHANNGTVFGTSQSQNIISTHMSSSNGSSSNHGNSSGLMLSSSMPVYRGSVPGFSPLAFHHSQQLPMSAQQHTPAHPMQRRRPRHSTEGLPPTAELNSSSHNPTSNVGGGAAAGPVLGSGSWNGPLAMLSAAGLLGAGFCDSGAVGGASGGGGNRLVGGGSLHAQGSGLSLQSGGGLGVATGGRMQMPVVSETSELTMFAPPQPPLPSQLMPSAQHHHQQHSQQQSSSQTGQSHSQGQHQQGHSHHAQHQHQQPVHRSLFQTSGGTSGGGMSGGSYSLDSALQPHPSSSVQGMHEQQLQQGYGSSSMLPDVRAVVDLQMAGDGSGHASGAGQQGYGERQMQRTSARTTPGADSPATEQQDPADWDPMFSEEALLDGPGRTLEQPLGFATEQPLGSSMLYDHMDAMVLPPSASSGPSYQSSQQQLPFGASLQALGQQQQYQGQSQSAMQTQQQQQQQQQQQWEAATDAAAANHAAAAASAYAASGRPQGQQLLHTFQSYQQQQQSQTQPLVMQQQRQAQPFAFGVFSNSTVGGSLNQNEIAMAVQQLFGGVPGSTNNSMQGTPLGSNQGSGISIAGAGIGPLHPPSGIANGSGPLGSNLGNNALQGDLGAAAAGGCFDFAPALGQQLLSQLQQSSQMQSQMHSLPPSQAHASQCRASPLQLLEQMHAQMQQQAQHGVVGGPSLQSPWMQFAALPQEQQQQQQQQQGTAFTSMQMGGGSINPAVFQSPQQQRSHQQQELTATAMVERQLQQQMLSRGLPFGGLQAPMMGAFNLGLDDCPGTAR